MSKLGHRVTARTAGAAQIDMGMPRSFLLPVLLCAISLSATSVYGQRSVLLESMHPLRNAREREWSSFPLQADSVLRLNFPAGPSPDGYTLELTQADVKQLWRVRVNGTLIGDLVQDEQLLKEYFSIPSAVLKASGNELTIATDARIADDIRVGEIVLHAAPPDALMTATVEIAIVDQQGAYLPARITIVNKAGSLQRISCDADSNIAVRPGCIYTPHPVSIRIPAGTYVLYAGRGFEYGVDSVSLDLGPGDYRKHRFVVKREVDTRGWIASDTHVHTFTYSKHGDATLRERLITLAGEGIEMPVMTDHNAYVDLHPVLDVAMHTDANLKMSPVVGDELTTAVGHFNVFRIPPGAKVPDPGSSDWRDVGRSIEAIGGKPVVVLNHARDTHNDFRPFDPSRHLSSVGMDLRNWRLPANAMEVINSGSQQTDMMLLFEDWFGMMNAGHLLTPIGSSDSHDVNRYIVGQGRTYIKGNDQDPAKVDTDAAIRSIINGEVMVSCGLLVKILVNRKYGPGNLAPSARRVGVAVDVLGPAWSNADSVSLYMNGIKIGKAAVTVRKGRPIRQRFAWKINVPSHDVFFAAVAHGRAPGIPFWPIARPYQPMSPEWTPKMYAASGAVWIDGNGNGTRESASSYAVKLISEFRNDLPKLIDHLAPYDESVARQAAALLWQSGSPLNDERLKHALNRSPAHVQSGFAVVLSEIGKRASPSSLPDDRR